MWANLLHVTAMSNDKWMLDSDLTLYLPYGTVTKISKYFPLWKQLGINIDQTPGGHKITAPEGFKTDLGSIYRIFWWFLSPWDIARAAAMHDYLYAGLRKNYGELPKSKRKVLRRQADKIFQYGMKHAKPKLSTIQIKVAYYFVRLAGGLILYFEHKKLNK